MAIKNFYDTIDFPEETPIDTIIETSMEKWMDKNVSSSRAIRLSTTKLEITIAGKKTGWYISADTYNEIHGVGYNTTPFAKLQCYPGFEEGLLISK